MKDLITAMRVLAEEVTRAAQETPSIVLGGLAGAMNLAVDRLEAELPKEVAPSEAPWVQWFGHRTPPLVTGPIEVQYRCGEVFEWREFKGIDWFHEGSPYDIIAYRVIP